jgi:hypothetical protein
MRTIAPCRHAWHGRQAGQSLIVALGVLLAGGVMLFTMFSAGQVAAAKQRLVDTADAAAWSAGLWRARVLNYHAYSNRAIVANEVAIAQAVTLLAWSKYFESLARNASLIGPFVPPAEPVLTGVLELATLAREAAEAAARIEVPARGAEAVGYKEILATSQALLHLSTQGFGLSMVAAEVARANDPDFFAWVLPDAEQGWQAFTQQGDGVEARRRFADLVLASLDPFTAGPRSEDIRTPIPSPCLNLMRLRKRGVTTLSDDLERWEAVDTMSFHRRGLRGLRCRETEALPLGWGAVETGTALGAVTGTAGEIDINPAANELASASITSLGGYAGIARVRELNYERLANTAFPTSGLAVIARERASAVPTAANIGLAAGRMRPPDAFAGDDAPHLWALSAAEVYFRRPADAPARLEYASLFNPYWQARLVAPSPAQRATALAYVR